MLNTVAVRVRLNQAFLDRDPKALEAALALLPNTAENCQFAQAVVSDAPADTKEWWFEGVPGIRFETESYTIFLYDVIQTLATLAGHHLSREEARYDRGYN